MKRMIEMMMKIVKLLIRSQLNMSSKNNNNNKINKIKLICDIYLNKILTKII